MGVYKDDLINQLALKSIEILEKSNTDITDEIILMFRTQQAFNGCSKMMQSDIDVTKKLSAR